MDDYISRQTAMDCLTGIYEYPVSLHEYIATTLKKIRNAPSADVQPVRHGHWIKEDRGGVEYTAVCSECGWTEFWSDRGKFCSECGARMTDGEQND